MNRIEDLRTLANAEPFIRSFAAFLVHLVRPQTPPDMCYQITDTFLTRLKRDLKDSCTPTVAEWAERHAADEPETVRGTRVKT